MSLEIVLTTRAKDTLLSTVSFIKLKWGDRSADKFVKKVYSVLDTISEQPYIFKAHRENSVRKGIISKQTSVIYRILDNRIEILFFWDNRQEPVDDI